MRQCLGCYELFNEFWSSNAEFHRACSVRIFRSAEQPEIASPHERLLSVAGSTLLGDSPLMTDHEANVDEFEYDEDASIEYVFKRKLWPTDESPENEDLTMHLASILGISTAAHSLMRLPTGELAYLVRRIDRTPNRTTRKNAPRLLRIDTEDFCELTSRHTSERRKGSMEEVAEIVKMRSANPVMDLVSVFERIVFAFLTGCAEVHLRKWTMIHGMAGDASEHDRMRLGSAFGLRSSFLEHSWLTNKRASENDRSSAEFSLTIGQKHSDFSRTDFLAFADRIGIPADFAKACFKTVAKRMPRLNDMIGKSFLSEANKQIYLQRMEERAIRLAI